MRNGVLLIESPPSEILFRLETNSLEQAFFRLCMDQESAGNSSQNVFTNSNKQISDGQFKLPEIEREITKLPMNGSMQKPKVKTNPTSINKLGALIRKVFEI